MTPCDDVQLSLEMLRKGASPLVPEAEARAHATTCATCAAYAAILKETQIMMSTSDLARRDGFDANAVLKKTLSELPSRRDVWKLVTLVVVGFVALVGYLYAAGRADLISPRVIGIWAAMSAFGVAAFAYRRTRHRVWARYAGRPIELLAARRTELRRRLRMATVAVLLFAALIAHNGYTAYARDSLLRVGLAVGYAFLLAVFLRNLVESRRELRELDRLGD